jgi:beta-lactamase superfamily II metal-dependent hydrolase
VDLGELSLTVIGRATAQLEALRGEWEKKTRGPRRTSPAELAAYLDETASNLSSIVVLAEHARKRILLTGDARGDLVLDGLERAKLIEPGSGSIKVDVLKVPHHGSARNVEPELFRRVLATDYVISAEGRHHNPDLDMLKMLTSARGEAPYRVWMTNDVPHVRKFFEADRKKNARRYGSCCRRRAPCPSP